MQTGTARSQPGLTLAVLLICSPLTALAQRSAGTVDLSKLEESVLNTSVTRVREGTFLRLAVEALVGGTPARGLGVLSQVFAGSLSERGGAERLSRPFLEDLSPAADAYLLLRLFHASGVDQALRGDVAAWLFESDERLRLFLDTITQEDDWAQCLTLIETLFDHDTDDRDEFLRLIMALSVVWDQPLEPLHHQMGGGMLRYETQITARYDYFKDLFQSGMTKMPYRQLSVTALTFVVHVPVPISELEWARRNVRGASSHWGKRFFDVEYAAYRAAGRIFQWPHGTYSLAAIRERGGICVDQAYYATITARAHGIPALIFVGEGRRGPHAWFGYLKNEREWELDAGRYAYDKYATGHAVDPQLNRSMTDHDVQFMCDRVLRGSRYEKATRYGRLAIVLLDLGYATAAEQCAGLGLSMVSVYSVCWHVKEQVLKQRGDQEQLVALLSQKANAFGRYPDHVAAIRQQQASLLRSLGKVSQAENLLSRNKKRVGRERDDLARYLVTEEVKLACERGDYTDARRTLEELLKAQRDEGQKVLSMVEAYLGLTSRTGQTREAARFLRRYLESVRTRSGSDTYNQAVCLKLLLTAYENDGDTRNAERVRTRLQRLQ